MPTPPASHRITTPEGHAFEAWTDGHAVGFKVTSPGREPRYVYLNPSDADDTGSAVAFLYAGDHGVPDQDDAISHVVLFADPDPEDLDPEDLDTPAAPGTPWGIEGHRPIVPTAAGVAPWCECGYRWDRNDPGSLLVGEHIGGIARQRGVPAGTHPGRLV